MSSNSSIIDQFIAAWSRRDIDEIMAFFHPDAEYTNIPIAVSYTHLTLPTSDLV